MFIEPNISGERRGFIEVICGSMFSGKTEELIRRLKRARIANLKTEIFKPKIDIRYHEMDIVSHDENAVKSTPIDNSQTILLLANDVDVVGIDEAQFFDPCDHSGAGHGFYRQAFWPDAELTGQSRFYYQTACHLRKMWKYCQLLVSQNG